jgi:hypothetical protein
MIAEKPSRLTVSYVSLKNDAVAVWLVGVHIKTTCHLNISVLSMDTEQNQ